MSGTSTVTRDRGIRHRPVVGFAGMRLAVFLDAAANAHTHDWISEQCLRYNVV